MEAINIEAIKINTIIERKILIRKESIDILNLAAISRIDYVLEFFCKI
jgi:hypothetical protein